MAVPPPWVEGSSASGKSSLNRKMEYLKRNPKSKLLRGVSSVGLENSLQGKRPDVFLFQKSVKNGIFLTDTPSKCHQNLAI